MLEISTLRFRVGLPLPFSLYPIVAKPFWKIFLRVY
jgi:hypothetical protein